MRRWLAVGLAVVVLAAGLAVAPVGLLLGGGLSEAQAQSSSGAAVLHRSEIVEGQSRYFEISNVPVRPEYWLVLSTGGSFTAESADFSAATRDRWARWQPITANGDGTRAFVDSYTNRISFEVVANADSDGAGDESFGVRLCTTAGCTGGTVLGDWEVAISEPGADTSVSGGSGASVTVHGGAAVSMMELTRNGDNRDRLATFEIDVTTAPTADIVIVASADTPVRTGWTLDGMPFMSPVAQVNSALSRDNHRVTNENYDPADAEYFVGRWASGETGKATVTVRSYDNAVDSAGGSVSGNLVFRVLNDDAAFDDDMANNATVYSGITIPDVPVVVTDDDEPTRVRVTAASPADAEATEGDSTDTAKFEVSLGRALVAGEVVTVPLRFSGAVLGTNFSFGLDGSPTGAAYADSSDGTQGELTFDGAGAQSATVVVTALSDTDTVSETLTVFIPQYSDEWRANHLVTNLAGGACAGTACPDRTSGDSPARGYKVTLREASPGLTVIDAGTGRVDEGDAYKYDVRLNTAPSGNVTVAVTSGDTSAATVTAGASLTFTPSGGTAWNVPQNVTVTPVDDSADSADTAVALTHAFSGDSTYAALSDVTHSVTVVDDDATVVAMAGAGVRVPSDSSTAANISKVMVEGDATRVDRSLTISLGRALEDGEFVRVPLYVEAVPNGNDPDADEPADTSGDEDAPTEPVPGTAGGGFGDPFGGPRYGANVSWPPSLNDMAMTATGAGVSFGHVNTAGPNYFGYRWVEFRGAGAQTATIEMHARAGFDDGDGFDEQFWVELVNDLEPFSDLLNPGATINWMQPQTNLGGGVEAWAEDADAYFGIADDDGSGGAVVVPADWPLLPAGVDSGDEFRLLYVTSQTTAATNLNAGFYDSFVRAEITGDDLTNGGVAALADYASGFRAIVGTAEEDSSGNIVRRAKAVQARNHARFNSADSDHPDVPIYWAGGAKVADGNADFADGSWDDEASPRHADGTAATVNADGYWTGSQDHGHWSTTTSGEPEPGNRAYCVAARMNGDQLLAMGATYVYVGRLATGSATDITTPLGPNITDANVGSQPSDHACVGRANTDTLPMYALSTTVFEAGGEIGITGGEAAEGSPVVFTVSRPVADTSAVTVTYTLSDGRGIPSDPAHIVAVGAAGGTGADYTNDYTGVGTVVIPANQTSATFSVPTTADTAYEGAHYFTAAITAVSGSNSIDTRNNTAVGAITDDGDAPVFAFGSATAAPGEGDGAVTLTVSKAGTTSVESSVYWTTADGTGASAAAHPGDYTAAAGTLVFAAGESSKSITVDIADDDTAESAESFTVSLSDPVDATLGSQASVAVTIADDDGGTAPVLVLGESGMSTVVSEEANIDHSDTYTVALSAQPSADVTVAITASDGAAVSVDGTASLSASLTFTNTTWSMAQSVAVSGVDDNTVNAGGFRTATISHATTSMDTAFNGLTASLDVQVVDTDPAPTLAITPAQVQSSAFASGGTAELTLTPEHLSFLGVGRGGGGGGGGDGSGDGDDHIDEHDNFTAAGLALFTVSGLTGLSIDSGVLGAIADDVHGQLEHRAATITVSYSGTAITSDATVTLTVDDKLLRRSLGGGKARRYSSDLTSTFTVKAPATATPVTVTMAKTGGNSDGNPVEDASDATGYVTVTLTLGRALTGTETVTVPLTVEGATVTDDFTFALEPSSQTGVSLATSGSHSAQNPAVEFASGATSATLRLTAVNNSDRSQPAVSVAYGTGGRAPSAGGDVTLGARTGSPITVVLVDDETGTLTVPADWALKPSGVAAGEEFRLLFITSERRNAVPTDIAVYNAWVQELIARRGHADIMLFSGLFTALGSTATVDARENTGMWDPALNSGAGGHTDGSGIPTYWLNGAKLADDYADFYDGNWDVSSRLNSDRIEDGRLRNAVTVPGGHHNADIWTGSSNDGTVSMRFGNSVGLGSDNMVRFARTSAGAPLNANLFEAKTASGALYGMSPVFRVATPTPVISIARGSSQAAAVAEGAMLTYTVTADPAPSASLTVSLEVMNERAGRDMLAAGEGGMQSVTFAMGETSKTYTVDTVADMVDEANSRVMLSVASGSGYTAHPTSASAMVIVRDDDNTGLAITQVGDGTVNEGSHVEYTVDPGRDLLVGETLTLALQTGHIDWTATLGTDYTVTCHGTGVTCTALTTDEPTLRVVGGTGVRRATVRYTALVDAVHPEADETVGLRWLLLGNSLAGSGGSLSLPSSVPDSTIRSGGVDVVMSVSGGDANGNAAENQSDGSEYVTITLTLDRALTGSETITVPLTVSGATVATDYTFALEPSSQTGISLTTTGGSHSAQNPAVEFASGARTATLRLTAVNNAVRTQPLVSIAYGTGSRAPTASSGIALGDVTGSPITVALADDETGDIEVPASWALAPSGLSAGDTFRLIFITSETRTAKATDIDDYNTWAQEIVARLGHEELQKYGSLVKVLGSTASTDARVNLGMWAGNAHTDGSTSAGSSGTEIYWVAVPSANKVADNYYDFFDGSWDGGSDQTAAVTTESGAAYSTDTVILAGSQANGEADTTEPLGGASQVWIGETDGGSFGDVIFRDRSVSNTTSGRMIAMSPVFKVAAAAVPELTFASAAYSVAENVSSGTVDVVVNASSAPSSALTVSLTTADGTATGGGVDYTAPGATFEFPANQTSHTISVAVVNDLFYENDTETFTLTLGASTESPAAYAVGTPAATTVTIADEDTVTVSIADAAITVLEDGLDTASGSDDSGTADGGVDILLEVARSEITVFVTLTPADGTATGASGGTGADFDSDAITGIGFIQSILVELPVTGDSNMEPDEKFEVALSVDSGQPRVSLGSTSTLTVTIADDDNPQGLLFDPPIGDGIEVPEAGTATYTVRPTTAPTGTVTVTITGAQQGITVDTDASMGGDQNSLTFTTSNWFVAQTVTVSAADDGDSMNEMVTLVHAPAGGGYTAAAHSGSYVAEADDDEVAGAAVTVTMAAAGGDTDGDIVEGQGGAAGYKTVTIMLDRPLTASETVTVPLLVAGATVGGDYTFGLEPPSGQTGVTLDTSTGSHSSQNPAVVFSGVGAQTATLRFLQNDNSKRSQPAISIAYGTVAATGTTIAASTGAPIGFSIVDDETGAIEVAADWALKPSGVAAGESFRLIFITSEIRDAVPTDIEVYNDWAQGVVARGGHTELKKYGGLVKVIGSTADDDARENTGMWNGSAWADGSTSASDSGVAVYWLAAPPANKVADNYADFYDGSWNGGYDQSQEDTTESGGSRTATGNFHSGSHEDGTAHSDDGELGASSVVRGSANAVNGTVPLNDSFGTPSTTALALMAVSPVFQVEAAAAPVVSVELMAVEGARTATGEVAFGEGEGGITPINFPVTATPAPTANLMVCVQVAESRHGGVDRVASSAEGVQTVTVTSSGSVEHMVAYANTAVDEPDSIVTVTVLAPEAAGCSLAAGSYTVSGSNGSDKARIVDDEATVAELASGDMVMVEGVPAGTAEVTVSLERRLYDGEVMEIELRLSTGTGAQLPHHGTPDFTVSSVSGSGVALSDAAVQATAPAGSTDPAPDHTAPKVTFTGDNSNTVQSATVTFAPTAGRDSDSDDETITVSLAPSITLRAATGSNVGGKATRHASDYKVDLTLAEAVAVSVSELRVAENGGTATYEVRLLTAPSGGNTTVAIDMEAGTGVNPDTSAATLTDKDGNAVSTLTFTHTDFSDAQTVTVTGVDELSVLDLVQDSPTYRDRSLVLSHTASGGGYSSDSLGDVAVVVQEAPQIEAYSGRISTAETPGPYRNGLPARHTLGVALQTDVFSTMDFFVRASDRPVGGPITVTLSVAPTYMEEDLSGVAARSDAKGPVTQKTGPVIGMQLTRSSPVVQSLTLTFEDRPVSSRGCGILFNDDGEMGDSTPDSSFACPRIVYLVKTSPVHGCQNIDVEVSGGSVRTGTGYDPEPITVHIWNGLNDKVRDKGGGYKSACPWPSVVPRWSDPRPEPRTEYCVLGGRFADPDARSCFHFVDSLPALAAGAGDWAPDGAQLLPEGTSTRYEIDLGVTVQVGQSYELELKPSGATMGDDYTLALDTDKSPHVTVDPNQPLDSAAPRLVFAPGARVASIVVEAADDAVHEREVLTIGYGEYRYKNAGRPDKVTYPKTKALFAIIDSTPLVPTEPVANLAVAADSPTAATASWDPVAGATAYNVSYQGNAADPLNDVSGAIHGHTATTWTFAHNAADPDTVITVTVTPVRTAGDGTATVYHALSSAADLDLAAAPACVVDLPADAVTAAEVTGWRDAHTGTAHVLRWNRVLEALGEDTGTGATAMTAAESEANENRFMRSRWDRVTRTLDALAQCDPPPDPPPTPEISITAAGGITEGGDATFTVTADPAPTAPIDVTVTITAIGDFGATPGSHTVTVSTGGTGTLTVATAGDSADEPDGSITAAISTGTGYTVSATAGTATAAVADDDDPPPPPPVCTPDLPDDAVTVAEVTGWRDAHSHDTAHVLRWNRVLAALGEDTGETPLTVEESQANENEFMRSRWDRVTRTLQAHAQCDDTSTDDDGTDDTSTDGTDDDDGTDDTSTDDTDDGTSGPPPPPPPAEPEVAITADGGISEGGDATFTVTADPAPAAPLDVTVTVTATGDYGATTGQRTVTIGTDGAGTLTVATADDETDEADGTITAAIDTGAGYTVSATAGTATAAVADDDDPPPPPPPPAEPEVAITADGDIAEGEDAVFTLTADPAPTAPLDVTVTITTTGDYGATATEDGDTDTTGGIITVTIGTDGTATLTVATADDDTDEADGTITAAIDDGAGYTASATAGTATAAVSDDDDPPQQTRLPPSQVSFSVDDAAAAEGETARIRVWLSDPAAKRVRIWWSTRYHYGGDHPAYPGRDHPQKRGWLAFEPGDVEHHIEIPLTDDTATEPDETFLIHLGFAEGGPKIADREATITITDND